MYWKHSYYEILKNIVGGCHTVDEAYRIVMELIDDRKISLEISKAEYDRTRSKQTSNKLNFDNAKNDIQKAKDTYKDLAHNYSEYRQARADMLMAKAFLKEQSTKNKTFVPCLEYCVKEIEFLEYLKETLEPMRKYGKYDDFTAYQLAYAEEVKYELVWRVYCELCSMDHISFDTWNAIKQDGSDFVENSVKELKEIPNKIRLQMNKQDIFGDSKFLVCNIPALTSNCKELILLQTGQKYIPDLGDEE